MPVRVDELLHRWAEKCGVQEEFEVGSLLKRQQRLAFDLAERYPKLNRGLRPLGEIGISVSGVGVGVIVGLDLLPTAADVVLLLGYVVICSLLAAFIWLVPEDAALFHSMIRRLKLTDLAERLAAQLAIFDSVLDVGADDDAEKIRRISAMVPEFDSADGLSAGDQGRVRGVLDPKRVFESERETGVRVEKLLLSPRQREELQDLAAELALLAERLFSGTQFSAKVYMVAEKFFETKPVRVLVAFARRAPTSPGSLGTSWLKARSDPTLVWKCLESGKLTSGASEEWNSYYKAVVAICLPGRTGVLALTSSDQDAFKGLDGGTEMKALQLASSDAVFRILGLR